jgi:hypothetical protein
MLPPQLVNQKLATNYLVRSQHQQCQERTSFRTGDLDGLAVVPDLERTEEAKFHTVTTLTPSVARENPWKCS